MINYKEVFQLAQDKGFSSCIDDQRTPEYLKATEIQKWLREAHKMFVIVEMRNAIAFGSKTYDKESIEIDSIYPFKTYEQALLVGINEALKLI